MIDKKKIYNNISIPTRINGKKINKTKQIKSKMFKNLSIFTIY